MGYRVFCVQSCINSFTKGKFYDIVKHCEFPYAVSTDSDFLYFLWSKNIDTENFDFDFAYHINKDLKKIGYSSTFFRNYDLNSYSNYWEFYYSSKTIEELRETLETLNKIEIKTGLIEQQISSINTLLSKGGN